MAAGRPMEDRQPDCPRLRPALQRRSLVRRCVGQAVLPPLVGIFGVAALGSVNAQESAGRAGWSIVPDIGIRETLTDNLHLASSDRRAELITEVSPRLRLSSNTGLVRGFLDYSLTGIVYARESSSNAVQQALRATGSVEAIEKWVYIDASASISQQNISALGTQTVGSSLPNDNRTEVASVRLSPYVRGRLGGFAEYEARVSFEATNSKQSNADSRSTVASLHIGSDAASFARLGWAADYSHLATDFSASGAGGNTIDRLTASLTLAATPELRLTARAGRESNDYSAPNNGSSATWGWSATWAPSERTTLDVSQDRRFFGKSHSVRFEHRMPRSVWTFSDTQDISTNASGAGAAGQRTVFDLLFAQFASIAPDPVLRTALVDAYLLNNGLTRATLASGGILTAGPSVQRNQRLSLAVLGVRTTLLVSAFHTDTHALDVASTVSGDLANGNAVRQNGQSVNLSHRLTPLSAISADFTRTHVTTAAGGQRTDLRSLTATWSTRFGARLDGSLSLRRAVFDAATNPYSENALIANLRVQF